LLVLAFAGSALAYVASIVTRIALVEFYPVVFVDHAAGDAGRGRRT
jgi:hypothetical protein